MKAAAGVFEYINQNAPNWSSNYRTFGHGAVHGMFTGLFVALPILATNAMFERKGFKYIAVNTGYWIITPYSNGRYYLPISHSKVKNISGAALIGVRPFLFRTFTLNL